MKITGIKISGLREPMGFRLPFVDVAWRVADTESRRAEKVILEIWDEERQVARAEGPDPPGGQVMEMALTPRTRYRVRVTVTGDRGDSATGESFFETGKMDEPWTARWIAGTGEEHPELCRSFDLRPGLARARLYVSAGGLFEVFVNGMKLGDEFLLPGLTDYEKHIQVITFPVENLRQGNNILTFRLGKGWYMGTYGLENKNKNYGDKMAVIGELHLTYDDGTQEVIPTDRQFRWRPSQVLDSGIYYGEDQDRNREPGPWRPAEVLEDSGNLRRENLTDRMSPPLRVHTVLPVREVLTTPAGETVLDFGQNFAGFPEFDADLPAGTTVALDFGETLQNGNFYNANYREARSRFTYVSGGRPETVRPSFTYFGFRYVRVTGWPGQVSAGVFRGCVLHSDMERTGRFHCGDPRVDRVYENSLWSMRSNFIDIPTDCPQRSERLGWTGDAQIFAAAASIHMDTRAFFRKFLRDLRDEQETLGGAVPNYIPNLGHKPEAASAWGDVATILPDVIWNTWGSIEELKQAYPLMRDWVDWMDRQDTGRRYVFEPPFQFGDWLALDGPTPTSFKGSTDDKFLGSAYYFRSARLTADAAARLELRRDAERFGTLAENIRRELLSEYFTPKGRFALDTQAAYVVALKFRLWTDHQRLLDQFVERLRKDNFKIRCGFIGAPMLCTVLAENGRADLAYDFLLGEGFPGWLYCVDLGATTIWERWNSIGPDGTISDTGMNSLNHYAYGSVAEFLYAYAGGLRPAGPGWRRAVLAPVPDWRLGSVEASFDSPSGKYTCNTAILPDGRISVHAEVPFGCEAELTLPRSGEGTLVLAAGSYDYTYTPTRDFRKPFDGKTPLAALGRCPEAVEVLKRLVPPAAGMALEQEGENSQRGLEDLRKMTFLGLDSLALEAAVREVSSLTVQRHETILKEEKV